MRPLSYLAVFPILFAAHPVVAATNEFVVGPEGAVDIVVNGKPARMLFRGVGSSTAIFNRASVEQLGIKRGIIKISIGYRIGPHRIGGRSGVARYSINGRSIKRRVGWFSRDVAPGFDGLLGPEAIDYPIVTQRLRAPLEGEKAIVLRSSSFGYNGVGVVLRGKPFTYMIFDPSAPTTIINAPFANEIASLLRGHFEGPVLDRVIAFGVSRPVRNIEFGIKFKLGTQAQHIAIHRADVRTLPGETTGSIPDQAPDPDEINVVANGAADKRARYMVVGADALKRCSSISFDKPKRQITLHCVPN